MTPFPDTSSTLLAKLVEQESGVDQASWCRFFAQYQPVMVEYARMKGAGDDAEDVVQEVFADLAKVFRAGRYAHEKGKFKAYLAKMLRNELVNRFRRREVRPERNSISVTEAQIEIERKLQGDYATYAGEDDSGDWATARHRAAMKHVLEKTAISEQSRRIFMRLLETGDNCAKVAREMGVAPAAVRQVKSRISRMIVAFEKTME